jgi:hypothetical protein
MSSIINGGLNEKQILDLEKKKRFDKTYNLVLDDTGHAYSDLCLQEKASRSRPMSRHNGRWNAGGFP